MTNLDGLGIELEAFLLIDQEFLNIFALIALKLDHLPHLAIVDDGAIASLTKQESARRMEAKQSTRRTKFLLDDLENLLLVEFLWKTLDCGQSLATIAFWRGRTRQRGREANKEYEDMGEGEHVRWIRIWM